MSLIESMITVPVIRKDIIIILAHFDSSHLQMDNIFEKISKLSEYYFKVLDLKSGNYFYLL